MLLGYFPGKVQLRVFVNNNNKSKWHTQTPTHGLASALRMRTARAVAGTGQTVGWCSSVSLAFIVVTGVSIAVYLTSN